MPIKRDFYASQQTDREFFSQTQQSMPRAAKMSKTAPASRKRNYTYKNNSTIAKTVRRVLQRTTELKEIGKYYSAIHPTATTGYVAYINDSIATGGDINDRIGRHITSQQIQVDYQVYVTGQTLDTGFVALVFDSQPNGGTPTFGDIFDDTLCPSGQAFRNTANNGDRFKVAKIEQFAVSSAGPAVEKKRMYYKVPDAVQDTEYLTGSAGVPSTGLWMLAIGSTNNSGTILSLDFLIKYQFTDK